MHTEIVIVFLFTVATAVAMGVRALKVPYTVALVVAGLVLGATHILPAQHLTKHLLYAVFLPGLVFEASFHLEFGSFKRNKVAISLLAIPGVVAGIALASVILTASANRLHFVEGFTFTDGLVLAAILAATDPIAVVALFKSLGVPKRMSVLVEGESLLNDGTAVVVFTLLFAATTGAQMSIGAAALDFVRIVGIGMLIGLAVGLVASKVIQQVDDPMIEITVTTIAAYGSFVAAEAFHFSGVIATVCAGMLCGNYAAQTGMSPSTRIAVATFWEYVAFALNSIIFLLIGLEVNLGQLAAASGPIAAAFVTLTLARAGVVMAAWLILRKTTERFPLNWTPVLTWGGLRGGLSMVLVLGLPESFVHRELLVTMTFGVVILSILLQGLTMAPLLRRLGMIGHSQERDAYEAALGQLRAVHAALAELDRLATARTIHADIVSPLRTEYQARLRDAEERVRLLYDAHAGLREGEQNAVRRQLLLAEKDAVLDAARRGAIHEHASASLLAEVDRRIEAAGSEE